MRGKLKVGKWVQYCHYGDAKFKYFIKYEHLPQPKQWNIHHTVVSGLWTVSIYNELGQSVYTKTGIGKINEQVNLENIAEGIYTVRLQTNAGNTVKKLVVMRK